MESAMYGIRPQRCTEERLTATHASGYKSSSMRTRDFVGVRRHNFQRELARGIPMTQRSGRSLRLGTLVTNGLEVSMSTLRDASCYTENKLVQPKAGALSQQPAPPTAGDQHRHWDLGKHGNVFTCMQNPTYVYQTRPSWRHNTQCQTQPQTSECRCAVVWACDGSCTSRWGHNQDWKKWKKCGWW